MLNVQRLKESLIAELWLHKGPAGATCKRSKSTLTASIVAAFVHYVATPMAFCCISWSRMDSSVSFLPMRS